MVDLADSEAVALHPKVLWQSQRLHLLPLIPLFLGVGRRLRGPLALNPAAISRAFDNPPAVGDVDGAVALLVADDLGLPRRIVAGLELLAGLASPPEDSPIRREVGEAGTLRVAGHLDAAGGGGDVRERGGAADQVRRLPGRQGGTALHCGDEGDEGEEESED